MSEVKRYPFRGKFCTVAEIVAATGFPETTVRSRLLHGRSLLRPFRQKIGDGAVIGSDGRRSSYEAHKRRKEHQSEVQRERYGLEPGQTGTNIPKPVVIDGRRFKSTAAAAKFFSVSDCTVRRVRLRLGDSFSRKDLRNPGEPRNTCPGSFDGKSYPSIIECSRQTGIPLHKLRKFYKKD